MSLPELCVRRPVLATVLNLLVVLLGVIAYGSLPVREYPNIDTPVVTVTTVYRGAAAAIVESQVTRILEDSLSGVEGLDFMTSVSRQENSQITINFRLTRNADAAAADVRDRVARARGQLPDTVEEPIVAKVEADAQPIIYLAFSSTRHSALEITDFAENFVADQIKALPGVAEVPIFGERRRAMRIWLDPLRLAAYGLTPADLEAALRGQNLEIPAGRIEGLQRELTISGQTDLRTVEEFRQLIIVERNATLVRLGDVARIEEAAEQDRVRARYNGQPAVALGIVKQSTANPLDVAEALQAAFPRLRQNLPAGMTIDMAYNSALFIQRSIAAVWKVVGEAVLLVVAVIFLFLGTMRATAIPLLAIPISLIGTFAIMAVLGFSVNTLTLLALVLAVGLVVDDAIVVLENTHRHIETGLSPYEAALRSGREMVFPVIAMSVTLAAVYLPMAFSTGKTGRLFTEFALVLAGTVLISGFVALTLSPMLCAYLLKAKGQHSRLAVRIDAALARLTDNYRQVLAEVMAARRLLAGLTLLLALAMAGFYLLLPKELAPTEDRSLLVGITIAPEGSALEYLDGYARQIEAMYAAMPDQTRFFMISGFPTVNQGISFLGLKPWEDRAMPAGAYVGQLFGQFMSLPGILAFPVQPPPLGANPRAQPVEFVIQTNGSYAALATITDRVLAAARANPGLVNLDVDLKLSKPELQFTINRDKAALLGVDVATIGQTLQTLFGGREVTRYQVGSKQYDVLLELAPADRRTPEALTGIRIRARDGTMVELSSLLTMAEVAAPRELNHFNKLRAATITASLNAGYPLGTALDFLATTTRAVGDGQVAVDFAGQSREFRETGATLLLVFGLALAFIYLVLAAQYESYIDPLTIMLSVPLALAGAMATLWLVGGTLNVYSQIGLITLVGLITKHGILIVEFANRARAEGVALVEAAITAASVRLRPILMTTAATMLGALPLALASGAGAESRQQIGWVIVGGMGFGTLLTLFVIPAAYVLLGRLQPRHRPA